VKEHPNRQECGRLCVTELERLFLTGCLLRVEARLSEFMFRRLSGASRFLNIPLPLIHPIRPFHSGISSNPAETRIHVKAIKKVIEGAFIDTINTKLHWTLTATIKPYLSTARVASAPIEAECSGTISAETVGSDHTSFESNGESTHSVSV
jgi:hypothetical protein